MIEIHKRSKPKLIVVLMVIALAMAGVVGWAIYSKVLVKPAVKEEKNSLVKDSVEQPSVKPTPMISLPDAKSIKPIDGRYSDDNHIWRLVNKSHPLNDAHYRPTSLEFFEGDSRDVKTRDERSVRADIAPAVKSLFAGAKENGFDLIIGSGFRSYEMQNFYYTSYIKNYGQSAADSFSAKPGYSEHQTGLVVDVATRDLKCYLEECFGETEAGKWLAVNAHKYGFILRYPRGKVGITDFIYEPWHFRYVGEDLAGALFQSGLTLDEAWPYLQAS